MEGSSQSRRRRASTAQKNSSSKRYKKNRSDKFCWNCHGAKGGLRSCTNCFRVYHRECLVSAETGRPIEITSPMEWICEECLAFNNRKKENPAEINLLLNYLINKTFDRNVYDELDSTFGNAIRSCQKVVEPMDIQTIQLKINNNEYDSTLGFLADVKLMRHCAEIVSATEKNILKQLKDFKDACVSEVYDLNLCKDCYKNSHESPNWFTFVCKLPHLLVWARTKGYPYWPAKILGVQGSQVCVRYFGNHERSFLSQDNIFHYSKENPNQDLSSKNKKLIDDCIPEVDQYIDNITKKVGHFDFAPVRKRFIVNEIGIYLEQMIAPVHQSAPEAEGDDIDSEYDTQYLEYFEESIIAPSANGHSTDNLDEEVISQSDPNTISNEMDIENNLDEDHSNQAEANESDSEPLLLIEAIFSGTEAEIDLIQYIGNFIEKQKDLKGQIKNDCDYYRRSYSDELEKCKRIQQQLDDSKAGLLKMEDHAKKLADDANQKFETIKAMKGEKIKIEADLSESNTQNELMKAELLKAKQRDSKFREEITGKDKTIQAMVDEKIQRTAEFLNATEQNDKLKVELEAKNKSIEEISNENERYKSENMETKKKCETLTSQLEQKDKSLRVISVEYEEGQTELLRNKELLYKLESEFAQKEELFGTLMKTTEKDVIIHLQEKFEYIKTRVLNESQKKELTETSQQ